MNAPGRPWSRVDALYHEIVARPPHERAAALAAACPNDPALAAEVRSLLDQPGSAAGFMVTPVLDVVARMVSGAHSSLTGQRIGIFELRDLLAVGGMGEVYRARDTKLGREVAIKVLSEVFAHDHERLARFNREAQALASLNHPNIAVIYGVAEMPATSGSGPGSRALVMELVEGEDLSARIARGPVPTGEALSIARQIAKALEAAHEQGIVHRDLKPANIKIRSDGTVKVLDFGLAKVRPLDTCAEPAGAFHAPTRDGAVMGTPGYMSPEQIRGQQVDCRSDLFSFGIVLYEMLAGKRAFAKGSDVETMGATLTEAPPDLTILAPRTSPALAATVARCLEKRPEDRFQSAKDLGLALEKLKARPRPFTGLGSLRLNSPLAVLTLLLAGLGFVGRSLLGDPAFRSTSTYRQVTTDGNSFTGDLSPDGETVVYVTTEGQARRLMIRDLTGGPPAELYRVEQGPLGKPRFSHSGRQVALQAGRSELIVISRFGGAPVRITLAANVFRISWSPDDTELVLSSAGAKWFWIASIERRQIRRIEMAAPSLGGFVTDVSPDGERLLLFGWQARNGVWSMKKDGTDLRQHVNEARRTLDARWAEDGASFYYLLIGANASEVRRARVLPEGPDPAPIVVEGNLTVQDSGATFMAISRNGRLAYPRVSLDRNLWRADISPSLSSHEKIPLRAVTNGARSEEPRFSPDRARIAFSQQDGELGQIALASTEGERKSILVSRRGSAGEPVWSPNGEAIGYWFDDDSGPVLHVADVRSGVDRTLRPVDLPSFLEWAPGARLAFRAAGEWGYTLVDPRTGNMGALTDPEEGTSYYSPRYSNRADRVALYYNARTRKSMVGLAIVSLPDRQLRMIPNTPHFLRPIGWSADDAIVYAVDSDLAELVAIRVDGGGIRTMGRLPSRNTFGDAVEVAGRLKLVLSYPNDRSDIWVVENFDGGRR